VISEDGGEPGPFQGLEKFVASYKQQMSSIDEMSSNDEILHAVKFPFFKEYTLYM
jgi:hypothetical protein